MGREGEGFFFFRAEWVSQIEESLSGCRAVGVARWFSKGVQKITRRREVVSLFPGIVSSPSGLNTFLPRKQALFSWWLIINGKKSPHLLPKISLTSPFFFFSQGRDSDHLPVVSAPLSRARQSEAEIMASPGPSRFAGGKVSRFTSRPSALFSFFIILELKYFCCFAHASSSPNLIQSDLLLSAGDRRGRRREMSQSDLFSYKLIKAHKKKKN